MPSKIAGHDPVGWRLRDLSYRGDMGAFQEQRQALIASPFCKFAHGIESVRRIPYYVEMATRNAIHGRPGATYLDVPDDITTGSRVMCGATSLPLKW